MNKNILEFYFKTLELKNVDRTGWVEVGIENPESVMDHIGGSIILAMAIATEKGLLLDMKKVYDMIIVKELKKAVYKSEESAVIPEYEEVKPKKDTTMDMLSILSNNEELKSVYDEYNEGTSKEARFVLMVSKLESDIQAKKYELDGKFTIENAKNDIKNYPENLRKELTDIENASDGWLLFDREYYDDVFKLIQDDVKKYN